MESFIGLARMDHEILEGGVPKDPSGPLKMVKKAWMR